MLLNLQTSTLGPLDLVFDVLYDFNQLVGLVGNLLDVIVGHVREIKYACRWRLPLTALCALQPLAFL